MPIETRSPEVLGPYTLIREVGRGGNSVVHQAVDRRTGKTVALKVHTIPPSLSSGDRNELMVRFAREARTLARLSHPGIVSIHEVGERDGHHFLAMEYVDGQTLRERLLIGAMASVEALAVLRQVAEALDAIHAAGIVHRDVKPGNVMLLPDGTAKLLDFGIARQSEDTAVTATHSLVGSPTYMAPEQVQGSLGDPASDRWSLGVLLFEMLAGHPPYMASSIPSVLYKVAHEAPPHVPHIAPRIQHVLQRSLEKEPSRRYPTAHALADAFQEAIQSSPAHDWRAGTRKAFFGAALLLVGAVLGIALSAHHGHPPALGISHTPFPAAPFPRQTPLPPHAAPSPLPRRVAHRLRRRHRPAHWHVQTAKPTLGIASKAPADPSVTPPPVHRPRPHIRPARSKTVRRLPVAGPGKRHVLPAERRRQTPIQRHEVPRAYVGETPPDQDAPPVPVDLHPVPPRPRHHDGSDSQKMQDLEKFIWSEGR